MGLAADHNARRDGSPENASMSALHIAAVFLCAIGFAIDLSEFAVGNALSAIFSKGPAALPPIALALLVGAAYAGAAVGAPLFGLLADRHGFRRMLVFLLVWLGAATVAAAASRTALELTSARFVAGLALGGYPPLMIAYLGDIAPLGKRGRMIFWACAIAYLGPPAMIFGIRWLTPLEPFGLEGWRCALGVAGILAFGAAVGLRALPEVPHGLRVNDRAVQAEGALERLSVQRTRQRRFPNGSVDLGVDGADPDAADWSRAVRRRLVLYAAGYVTVAIGTVAFPLVTGPVLLSRGVSLNDALYYVGLGSLGPFLGTLMAGTFIDGISRRAALVSSASMMLAAVVLFFSSPDTAALIVAVLAFAIGMALYLPTIAAVGTETFPRRVRGVASASGWASNRVAAALTPLVVLPLARIGQVQLVETIIFASILATIALVSIPETKVESALGRTALPAGTGG